MTTLTTIPAYHRNADGTLDRINVLTDRVGSVFDAHGYPLTDTHEDVELVGWSHDQTRRFINDGGREILVPRELL
jgi:hypothetical protein